jgi:hypothetical protein
MRTQRLFSFLAIGGLTLVLAQCGGGSSPTSPSDTGGPSPSPSPSPAPAGSSLTVTPQEVAGQTQPQGTVTIPSNAPAGGVMISLSSDNTDVVKVPATVMIPGGSRSTSFLIDTASVGAARTVRITASYSGGSMSTTLTVTPPKALALNASFVVTSRTKGAGACVVDGGTRQLDCVFDATPSQGAIDAYLWTYTMGSMTLSYSAPSNNASSNPPNTGCSLYQQGTGGDGPNGEKFLNMTVTLQVRDAAGTTTPVIGQQVKVYPNKQCGFNY